MDLSTAILTGLGLAAAAGLNAYIPLLVVGLLGAVDWIALPEPYSLLANPWVLAVVAVLLAVEVLADKIPAVDSANDVIGTVVRPAAGAVLFAASTGVTGSLSPELSLVLGLVTAGAVHGTKAAARPVLNAGTAGAAAPVVSTVEDAVSFGLALVAIFVPIAVVLFLVVFTVWAVRAIRRRRSHRAAPVSGDSRLGSG